MNYKRCYELLVEKARLENRKKHTDLLVYYENHHIIPKCLKGANNPDNLVLLTAREHFLAHWLLVKMYPENFKLLCAWNAFCQSQHNQRSVSRFYEYCRLRFVQSLKTNEERKAKNSKTVKQQRWVNNGKETTRIHKDLVNDYLTKGWVRGRMYFIRGAHSEETVEKIRLSNTGKKLSEETKKKHSLNSKGKIWINDTNVSKMVKPYKLHTFLNLGWKEGRILSEEAKRNIAHNSWNTRFKRER